MRAREPDREGDLNRDGVRLHYEVFGSGEPTLVLVPSNPIVHSRQVEGAGPDRPVTPEAHTDEACVADLEAVLAATCPEPAVLIGLCSERRSAGGCEPRCRSSTATTTAASPCPGGAAGRADRSAADHH